MNKPLVVLLGYKAGSGKDTLGNLLVENSGFVRKGFADKIKYVVKDIYDLSDEQVFGSLKNIPDMRYALPLDKQSKVKTYYTPREICQEFAEENKKRFPNIWSTVVANEIKHATLSELKEHKYVITDFRFPAEHKIMRDYAEMYGWNVLAVNIIRPDREENFVGSTHISETALDDYESFDFEILNDWTPQEMFNQFEIHLKDRF